MITPPLRSVFCYPDLPKEQHLIWHVLQAAGWAIVPTRFEADLCMLFRDTTTIDLAPDDPYAAESEQWVNGRMRDISKRRVQQLVEEIFGYPLAIDPLTYQGPALRKSNRNYAKDARIITCPLAPGEIDDQYVYQRLIDTSIEGFGFRDLRTTIAGGEIAFIQKKISRNWIPNGVLSMEVIDRNYIMPEAELTPEERDRIRTFCRTIGCDFGSLDILRDNTDRRLYIVDANNTPGRTFVRNMPPWVLQEYLLRLASAIDAAFPHA